MTTRIALINDALMRIGALPLQSDTVAAAASFVAVYDGVLGRLGAYPWTFQRQTRRLVRLAAAPEIGWLYAYQLPAEMQGPPRAVYSDATSNRPITDYDVQDGQLLANAETVWIAFPGLGNPARWPGDVRELVRTALMAEYALSVREDRGLHDRLYQKAFGTPAQNGMGGLLSSSLSNDAQATPSGIVGNGVNPLIDARY